MEKINIAEILKDCPSGMKLYSPIFGDVYLDEFRPHLAVVVRTSDKQREEFLYDGRFGINGECMLFPSKENRDWRSFQRPFKDGDILVNVLTRQPFIFKKLNNSSGCYSYCGIDSLSGLFQLGSNNWASVKTLGFPTEEEKQKLFKAIKDNGYKWNPETKTLEKLIKPNNREEIGVLLVTEPNNWELVPNKFGINTLKPFDKVLIRDLNGQIWTVDMFSFYNENLVYPFNCIGHCSVQCIPYENNEHLLGTTDDCDDFYKTWE